MLLPITDLDTLITNAPQVGATGLLIFFILALSKGWVIFKREVDQTQERLDAMERERNDWRELALRGTDLAEGLAQVQSRRVFGDEK